jgi:endonuclease/exonuclease/phosphatase family metal-dependent hydrolase
MRSHVLIIIACMSFLPAAVLSSQPARESIRVLSINIWSGIDYAGIIRYGEYEPKERRLLRYNALVTQIRDLDPDIIFIQEANFAGPLARRLARELDYAEIHQVVNAGVKFGPVGLPVNFKEGLVILARKSLSLERVDVWKLSGSIGIHGDPISLHFDESVLVLVGKITVGNTPVYLVNVHLHAAMADDDSVLYLFREHSESGGTEAINRLYSSIERNYIEAHRLVEKLRQLPADTPVIVAGDFNAVPNSRTMRYMLEEEGFIDTFEANYTGGPIYTWDYHRNTNIQLYIDPPDVDEKTLWDFDVLKSLSGTVSRRIDYILLSPHFSSDDVMSCRIVMDSSIEGVQASDHFGIIADISLEEALADAPKQYNVLTRSRKKVLEPLPILMYDTDIGFGYGAKVFFLNQFGRNESFDLTLFNSTKGERWYRFVFSAPDAELRQGKVYPLAFDLIVDYDKYLNNNYFGIGNGSSRENREYYSREPFDVSILLSSGFTTNVVGQARLRYNSIRNFNFENDSRLKELHPALNASTVRYVSGTGMLRYDTRDSYINPSRGIVLQGDIEYAPAAGFTNTEFIKYRGIVQYYAILFFPTTILAVRASIQSISSDTLPVQILLPIGGGSTVRGYPQDRFLDRESGLFNGELRFPIYRRFGGVAGIDAGQVWHSLSDVTSRGQVYSYVGGLRYYMKTYVVRFDMGFSREGIGVYFNFGHLF